MSRITSAINHAGVGRFQWLLLGYTGLAWAGDACETMILSYLGPSVACAWPDSVGPFQESLLTSVVFIGMMIGVYSLGAAADAFGRRKGFFLSAAILGGAGLASAAALSFPMLLALRTIVGAALGGTPIAVTLFSEFLPTSKRGSLVLLLQAFWTLGTAAEAVLAWVVLPTLGWRWLLAFSAAPMFILLIGYPLLPESPHWLMARGKVAEAEAVVTRVARINGVSIRNIDLHSSADRNGDQSTISNEEEGLSIAYDDEQVVAGDENTEIYMFGYRQHGNNSFTANASLLDYPMRMYIQVKAFFLHSLGQIFSPKLRYTTSLLWCIWFVNALSYYGLVLLTTALQTTRKDRPRCTADGRPNFESSDYAAVLITSAAEAPGLAIAAAFVDNRGRIWCIRAGLLGCAVCILGLLFLDDASAKALQLVLLFIARACIEGTFSVLYVYTPELYDTKVRSTGLALCNAFSRLGGFAAPFVTVYLVESGRTGTAELVLGGLLCAAAVAALALPVETKGVDLGGGSGGGGARNSEESIERNAELERLTHDTNNSNNTMES